jgi:hypothetical protein
MNHRTVLRLRRLRWLELQVKKHKENRFRTGNPSRLLRAVSFEKAVESAFSAIDLGEVRDFGL